MRTRTKVFLLLGCLAAVIALTAYVRHDEGPSYKGHSLLEWLLLYDSSVIREDQPPGANRATQAVRAIGTNALPCLLTWMRYEPSPWRNKAIAFLKTLPPAIGQNAVVAAMFPEGPERRFFLAALAFDLQGPQAAPAIPELTRLMNATNTPNTSQMAIRALASIGTEALPALLTALTNSQFAYRSHVATYVSFARHRAGTNIASAVPLLAQCAGDPDPDLAKAAVEALGRIGLEPNVSLPPIIRALASTNQTTRLAAARTLPKFGAYAWRAVPALQAALNDSDKRVRYAATNALLEMAPTALTNTPAQ